MRGRAGIGGPSMPERVIGSPDHEIPMPSIVAFTPNGYPSLRAGAGNFRFTSRDIPWAVFHSVKES